MESSNKKTPLCPLVPPFAKVVVCKCTVTPFPCCRHLYCRLFCLKMCWTLPEITVVTT